MITNIVLNQGGGGSSSGGGGSGTLQIVVKYLNVHVTTPSCFQRSYRFFNKEVILEDWIDTSITQFICRSI